MSTRLLRANSSARDGVSNSSRLSLPSICRTISASSNRLENRSSTMSTVFRWARANASSETTPVAAGAGRAKADMGFLCMRPGQCAKRVWRSKARRVPLTATLAYSVFCRSDSRASVQTGLSISHFAQILQVPAPGIHCRRANAPLTSRVPKVTVDGDRSAQLRCIIVHDSQPVDRQYNASMPRRSHLPTSNAAAKPFMRGEGGATEPKGDRADAHFVAELGARIRALRERQRVSRKRLAHESKISERYLAQIESGRANISVVLLRRVAETLGVGIAQLVAANAVGGAARRNRIALIGMRGAGKSTLGAMLADALRIPLVELNREVAREAGLPAGEVMALYGHAAYRRI